MISKRLNTPVLIILLCFATAACDSSIFSTSDRNYSYKGIELGMPVTKLESMDNLTEHRSISNLLNPGLRMFRFNDSSHNSVVAEYGVVRQINIYDFSKNQDIQKKKRALIAEYGEPTYVYEEDDSILMGWGEVKMDGESLSAKGNFITADISSSLTQVNLTMGDPDGWHEYSNVIRM